MKKYIAFFPIAALSLLAFSSCMKEDVKVGAAADVETTDDLLSFSVDMSKYWNNNGTQTKSGDALIGSRPDSMSETKGTPISSGTLSTAVSQIGVVGFLANSSDYFVYNKDGFAKSETLTYSPGSGSGSGSWSTAETYYWPKVKALDFVAWAPGDVIKSASERSSAGADVKISNFTVTNSSDAHTVAFDYDLGTTDAVKQPDLMFASSLNQTRTAATLSPVQLDLKHAFSAVQFKIKAKQDGYLSTIALGSVAKTGKCSFDESAGTFSWTNGTTGSFSHDFATTLVKDTYTDLYNVTTGNPAATFMMIPQTIAEKTKTISFSIKPDDGTGATPYVLKGYIPAGTWEAGKTYIYSVDIDNIDNISITVTVKNWIDVDGGTILLE